MRKVLLAILVLALIGTGTVFASAQSEGGVPATGAPKKLEITKAYFFSSGDPTENPDQKAEYLAWFKQQFNVELKLNEYPRPEYMTKYALAVSSGEIHGLGWIFGGSYMEDYFNDGATVALDEYVAKNANWSKLEKGMREGFSRNGKLLALPSAWEPGGWFARQIRTDWLTKLGMKMPNTIDEFYKIVEAFTTKDPDGNGKADTVGMTSSGVWNIQDIFHSFGVPTNHVGDHCVTMDPHDGMRFNDGMLKPQMVDCLKWLNDVYTKGYLDKEIWTNGGSQMRERMMSGFAGSTYYWTHYAPAFQSGAIKNVPTATFDNIVGMTTKYAQTNVNLGGAYGAGTPYVLITGTTNPQEQVDAFIDIFLTDPIGHWSGRYGVYGKYWKFSDKKEVVRLQKGVDAKGTATYYSGPGFVSNVYPKLNVLSYPYVVDGNPTATENGKKAALQADAWLQEGLKKNYLFGYKEDEKEPNSETYRAIGADLKRVFVEQVTKAMLGQSTVDDAIATYRSQMKALGAQKMLDEGNAKWGRTSSTVYRY